MEDATNVNTEIFALICEYGADSEFQNAQQQFLFDNKDKFEDVEENPLEYTTIHESYVEILNNLIDAKLKEKYSEEQVTAFYDGFKEDFSTY